MGRPLNDRLTLPGAWPVKRHTQAGELGSYQPLPSSGASTRAGSGGVRVHCNCGPSRTSKTWPTPRLAEPPTPAPWPLSTTSGGAPALPGACCCGQPSIVLGTVVMTTVARAAVGALTMSVAVAARAGGASVGWSALVGLAAAAGWVAATMVAGARLPGPAQAASASVKVNAASRPGSQRSQTAVEAGRLKGPCCLVVIVPASFNTAGADRRSPALQLN